MYKGYENGGLLYYLIDEDDINGRIFINEDDINYSKNQWDKFVDYIKKTQEP